MRILITGSGGRIGRALYVRLAAAHEVAGLDRSPASTVQHLGEIGDAGLLARALDGVEAVIHVAALHAPHVGWASEAEFQRINVDGTASLVEAARRAGVRRIVYTSSTAVYGRAATPPGRAGWVDEGLAPEPETIYHRSKLEAEALLRAAALAGGPSLRILRMSRCFPEPAPVMAAFRLHRGIDARDVAAAHALALAHQGAEQQVFVVSGATPFRPDDAEGLWHDAPSVLALRAPALVAAFAARGWSLPRRIDRVYDPGSAARALGWRAQHGWTEVLAQHDRGSAEVLPPLRDFHAIGD